MGCEAGGFALYLVGPPAHGRAHRAEDEGAKVGAAWVSALAQLARVLGADLHYLGMAHPVVPAGGSGRQAQLLAGVDSLSAISVSRCC